MNKYDVIVVGGGAAGSFFAGMLNTLSPVKSGKETQNLTPRDSAGSFCVPRLSAESHPCSILIVEKNRDFMKKLSITGKGRCNIVNDCDVETVLRNIPRNPLFMRSSLSKFTPSDAMTFFEGIGVPLKTERGGRVFPVSDKAGDVVEALKRSSGTKSVRNRVAGIIVEDGEVKGVKCVDGTTFSAPNVVIATGGLSYPATGSTGDGYKLATDCGHTIVPPRPALVPIETQEAPQMQDLSGLTLKNVKLKLTDNNKAIFEQQGEMLFTHFGVSGPLVLTASTYLNQLTIVNCQLSTVRQLSIDVKPALDEKTLDARILRDFSENKNRQFKNSLSGLLPEKMAAVFVGRSGISPDKKVNEITKAERRRLLSLFKDFRLTVVGTRPIDEAVVTDGGVSVKEINPATMESKLVKGLYFAGEVIDVFGFTGGFNLQIAWSTAFAAACGVCALMNN
ncbi:MAG: NAD(P)/FAD-dependent oxidoreductase [Oscillospiraceae bacterium]|nr:NAD(P)/FAD-dependent oxidoreductase [Oscillospiraceae bacterium]